jgi:hypothetical protein
VIVIKNLTKRSVKEKVCIRVRVRVRVRITDLILITANLKSNPNPCLNPSPKPSFKPNPNSNPTVLPLSEILIEMNDFTPTAPSLPSHFDTPYHSYYEINTERENLSYSLSPVQLHSFSPRYSHPPSHFDVSRSFDDDLMALLQQEGDNNKSGVNHEFSFMAHSLCCSPRFASKIDDGGVSSRCFARPFWMILQALSRHLKISMNPFSLYYEMRVKGLEKINSTTARLTIARERYMSVERGRESVRLIS